MLEAHAPSCRVRFAPSPTGHLHVGGARTALFNWLFARRAGGTFILRIEDTDRERSTPELTAGILEGLAWLGLGHDEGPYFQSERGELYRRFAARLLDEGHAYRCFCSTEEIDTERQAAEREGTSCWPTHRCRHLDPAEAGRREERGERPALRFRVPEGETVIEDGVYGPVRVANAEIEDFVLLRSDGSPTYHLGVVADDADLRITHVVRGRDHLSNTPKQMLLYQAAGLQPPRFAHLPLILGEDRARLSKRHGATSVIEFRREGYLPEALFNYLALLCWSPGDDREVLGREEIVALFSLEGVRPVDAIFDLKKLEWMNQQYITARPAADLLPDVQAALAEAGLWRESLAGAERAWLLSLVDLLKPRVRRLPDFAAHGRPYLNEDFEITAEARQKHLRHPGLAGLLRALAADLESGTSPAFTPAETEPMLRATAGRLGVKAAVLIHGARAAVTGQAVSPSVFEVLEVAGRERTLARLRRLADLLEADPSFAA